MCDSGLVAAMGLGPPRHPLPCAQAPFSASLPSSRQELPTTFKPHMLMLSPGSICFASPCPLGPAALLPLLSSCLCICL